MFTANPNEKYSLTVSTAIKEHYYNFISEKKDEYLEREFQIYANKIIAKHPDDSESAIRIACIVTPLFGIKDEPLSRRLLDKVILCSKGYNFEQLDIIVTQLISSVKNKIINRDTLQFVMDVGSISIFDFCQNIQANLSKVIANNLQEINTQLCAVFKNIHPDVELPLDTIKDITQKISSHLKLVDIRPLIPTMEKIFKTDIHLWPIVIDVVVQLDLTLKDKIEAADDLITLTRYNILTEQHREIFKLILHLDDVQYLYPSSNKPHLNDVAYFFKTYPELLIFNAFKFPVKNKLTKLSAYHFLITMIDLDFQRKLVALIARIELFRPKFAAVLENAINQGMLTHINVDGLAHIPSEQLEDFFNNNFQANIAMLNDFNITQSTDITQLKLNYPEADDADIIDILLDNPSLSPQQLNFVVAFLTSNPKNTMGNT